MGIARRAFEASGGFGSIHPGEDPDLSLRLKKLGFSTCLIPEARVFHKRRIDWEKFYLQVQKFGMVRPILNKWHPGTGKITYWFPLVFILGLIFSVFLFVLGYPFFNRFIRDLFSGHGTRRCDKTEKFLYWLTGGAGNFYAIQRLWMGIFEVLYRHSPAT